MLPLMVSLASTTARAILDLLLIGALLRVSAEVVHWA